jgi:superfamily II DNA or RNA helicase
MADFPILMRPYQIDAIAIGIRNPYMTFHICTGGGKTAIFEAIAHTLELKTLVIVNRDDLLLQHIKVLRKHMAEDVGIIQGNKMDFDHQICVGTVQTIMAKMKSNRYKMNKYMKSVEYVVSDECHHAQSITWRRAIRLCSNAIYRHGFSGSPWDHATSNIELEAICGKIKCKITTSDLIKLGYLARPVITFHRYRGNGTPIDGPNLPIMYENTIVNNTTRNRAILDVVEEEYNKGDKLLLVVNRIKHGELLAQGLRKRGIHDREIGYLHGSKGRVTRVRGKKEFERGEIRIMIVSQIWNEGIDIPSCDVLVKADSFGGGEVQDSEGVRNLIQQIGRTLRKQIQKGAIDVDTKKEHRVRVHDFADRQNKHVEKWTRNRMRTCLHEPEWIVRVEDI